MPLEPRASEDYPPRQVEAARRVIVDVMQVLAAFRDCIVLVGGWVPELAIENPDEPHIGSIDVDLALDANRLHDGRYASMLELLLNTGRYQQGPKPFQFNALVDLGDGGPEISVEVDFLAPTDVRTEKNTPKLIDAFRVLKAQGCNAAFNGPLVKKMPGTMLSGAENTVSLQVASVADFLVMKVFALDGRDKPKDSYDICFCLDNYEDGIDALAEAWIARKETDPQIREALSILEEKFASVTSYGPQQVVSFHNSPNSEIRDQHARRAFELVNVFIAKVQP